MSDKLALQIGGRTMFADLDTRDMIYMTFDDFVERCVKPAVAAITSSMDMKFKADAVPQSQQ